MNNRPETLKYRVGVSSFSGIAAGFSQHFKGVAYGGNGEAINVEIYDAASGSVSGYRLVYIVAESQPSDNTLLIKKGTRFDASNDPSKVLIMANGYYINGNSGKYEVVSVSDANSYASLASSCITCNATGDSAPTFANGKSWNYLKQLYLTLSDDDQALIKNGKTSEDETIKAFAEKYSYIIAKYGTSSYANFISMSDINPLSRYSANVVNSVNNSTLLMAVILVSLLSLLAFIFIYKKKMHQ